MFSYQLFAKKVNGSWRATTPIELRTRRFGSPFRSYIDRQNRNSERLSGNSERFNQGDGDVPWEDQRVEIPSTQVARRTCSGCVPNPKKNPNHSGSLRMVTGKPDPSQTDLEVPRPTSSTSFRLSKAAPTCCCQHAASTNCTSTRLTQEV